MLTSFFTTVKTLGQKTFKSASNHNIALHGAAIAFYTIFSIAPLIILILALISLILGEQQTMQVFTSYLQQLFGADIASTLIESANESRSKSTGIIASIVVTGLLLFGATTVISQLKSSLNTIWEIVPPETNSITQFFLNRFISLVVIFMLTGLFITSLLLEGGITFFTELLLPYLPDIFLPSLKIASYLFSVLVTIVFFTLIFRILPDINARWKNIFVGAVVTTILFLIGKYIIGFYLGSTSIQTSYKAAGSFIIFLIWVYYNVQIVLLGAEFTNIYARSFGKDIKEVKTIKSFR
jgi:membrane protein